MRGDGSVFRRGEKWYIAYQAPGPDGLVSRREVGGTEQEARALLKRRIREVANDRDGIARYEAPSAGKVKLAQLLDDVVLYYETTGLKSIRELKNHIKRPKAELGEKAAAAVTTKVVWGYIQLRRKEGAADATIDRETETIRRAFTLAKMVNKPEIPKLVKGNANARQGFQTEATFRKILEHIPDEDFRDVLWWQWWTGMRYGETASLTWDTYDEAAGRIRLAHASAKTGHGRAIPLVGQLKVLITRRVARKIDGCPLIFHARGATILAKSGGAQFRLAEMWRTARAKVPGQSAAFVHDLRRTAIRNFVQAKVPVKTAMDITGHTTMATFHRYLITPLDDVARALEATEKLLAEQAAKDANVVAFRVPA